MARTPTRGAAARKPLMQIDTTMEPPGKENPPGTPWTSAGAAKPAPLRLQPAQTASLHAPENLVHARTVWISDLHLGSRSSKADRLLDFLRHTRCEHLFLVGDIIDGWNLEERWYWPRCHGEVLRELLRRAVSGVRVTYLHGNHDEFIGRLAGLRFAGAAFCREAVHTLRDGRRILVTHGDCFDIATNSRRWVARLDSRVLEWAHWLCRPFGSLRRRLGLPWRSWLACVREWVEDAVAPVSAYEAYLLGEVRSLGLDGVVCGHNHRPDLRIRRGLVYGNDGDWVESCTALVEHFDGRLELLRWPA